MTRVTLSEEQLKLVQSYTLKMLVEVNRLCRKHELRYSLAYGTLLGAIRHKGFIPWDDDVDIWMPRRDLVKFREICKQELNSKFFYQSNETDKEYYLLFDKIRYNGTIFKETYYEDYNIHHGVYIDIFPIDNIPDGILADKWRIFSYEFCRIGIQTRYLKADMRKGKKRILAKILGKIYSPIPIAFLYKKGEVIAAKYSDVCCRKVSNIFFPDKSHRFDANYFKNFIEVNFCGHKMMICAEFEKILFIEYGDYMKLPPENERTPKHDLVELKL